jgi:pyridoxal phosphate enzyme (YggS family)
MNDLSSKLENLSSRLSSACLKIGRSPSEVRILAVSKRHSANKIRELHLAGQLSFGENYIQEALEKQAELAELPIEWHFIGPVQSNKTRDIAEHFSWIQSVDRAKILHRLSQQRPVNMPSLNVCLQLNIDNEEQKSGAGPEEIEDLARLTQSLPGLSLRGLMAIPKADGNGGTNLDSFCRVQRVYRQLQDKGYPMDTLSMGMSSDFERAIQAGSTLVRIGTDLFGPRD